MKKILFCLYNLDIGGIETSFINLMKNFDFSKYEVTVLLEEKTGIFLDELPKNVKIIDYNLNYSKNAIIRKIRNRSKLISFIIKNYHKYDFSVNYTNRRVCDITSRYASVNNVVWIHGNYYHTKEEGIKFLKKANILKYKKIVFVSNSLKDKYLDIVSDVKQKLYVFNNIIDHEKIYKLVKEIKIKKDKTTFVTVGRHHDKEKNLIMMFDVMKRLEKDGYNVTLNVIGDGVDHERYVLYVKHLKLDKNINFLGKMRNPYPYIKNADALLLTSPNEGNPVVFLEAKVLNVPIITTNVSDSMIDIKDKYGMVSNNNADDYYKAVKYFLDKGFIIKEQFDPIGYNKSVLENVYKVFDE